MSILFLPLCLKCRLSCFAEKRHLPRRPYWPRRDCLDAVLRAQPPSYASPLDYVSMTLFVADGAAMRRAFKMLLRMLRAPATLNLFLAIE